MKKLRVGPFDVYLVRPGDQLPGAAVPTKQEPLAYLMAGIFGVVAGLAGVRVGSAIADPIVGPWTVIMSWIITGLSAFIMLGALAMWANQAEADEKARWWS